MIYINSKHRRRYTQRDFAHMAHVEPGIPWAAWTVILILTVTTSWVMLHTAGVDDQLISHTILETLRILRS